MTATTNDKYAALIEEIYARTLADTAKWENTSEENTYSTRLGKYTFHIEEVEIQESDYYRAIIYDQDGTIIDLFTTGSLMSRVTKVGEFPSYFSLMRELHRRAGRAASGAEKVLDDILANLGVRPIEDGDIPF